MTANAYSLDSLKMWKCFVTGMQFTLLTFSVHCSLICLLPVYFQPHWKCLKVLLDNTCELKYAELLEDDENGQWIDASECSKKPGKDCFLLELACNFRFDDSFTAWNYVYILRIHFWQISASWILQDMQIQTWKYILKGGILIDISLIKATVGEQKEEWWQWSKNESTAFMRFMWEVLRRRYSFKENKPSQTQNRKKNPPSNIDLMMLVCFLFWFGVLFWREGYSCIIWGKVWLIQIGFLNFFNYYYFNGIIIF